MNDEPDPHQVISLLFEARDLGFACSSLAGGMLFGVSGF